MIQGGRDAAATILMESQNLADKLRSTTDFADSNDRFLPVGEDAVYSSIVTRSVGASFYDAIVKRMQFPQNLPQGLLTQVVFERPTELKVATAWTSIESGRRFFNERVAPAIGLVIAEHGERGDVVRDEYRLSGLNIGRQANRFDVANFFESTTAIAYRTELAVPLDPAAGRTLRAFFERIPAIRDDVAMQAARNDGLAIEFGGVTKHGLESIHVHTDHSAAEALINREIPRLVEQQFADWDGYELSIESYPVHRCLVTTAAIESL